MCMYTCVPEGMRESLGEAPESLSENLSCVLGPEQILSRECSGPERILSGKLQDLSEFQPENSGARATFRHRKIHRWRVRG